MSRRGLLHFIGVLWFVEHLSDLTTDFKRIYREFTCLVIHQGHFIADCDHDIVLKKLDFVECLKLSTSMLSFSS